MEKTYRIDLYNHYDKLIYRGPTKWTKDEAKETAESANFHCGQFNHVAVETIIEPGQAQADEP